MNLLIHNMIRQIHWMLRILKGINRLIKSFTSPFGKKVPSSAAGAAPAVKLTSASMFTDVFPLANAVP